MEFNLSISDLFFEPNFGFAADKVFFRCFSIWRTNIFCEIAPFDSREQETRRRRYDILIERVFRAEEKKADTNVGRVDLEALEKEISIDIAELRRDLRGLRR